MKKINIYDIDNNKWYFKFSFIYVIIIFSIISISIGYSALNTTLNISGDAKVLAHEANIKFTGCNYISATDGAYENYACSFVDNTLITSIELPIKTSTITYELEVTNFVDVSLFLDKINNLTFSNTRIEYTLDNFAVKSIVEGISSLTFNITFSHRSNSNMGVTSLDSQLEFVYVEKVSVLVSSAGYSGNDGTKFWRSPINKGTVETISFVNTNIVPTDVIGSWDAGNTTDGSVMAWYYDEDSNGLFELYIGGVNGVTAHSNSSNFLKAFINLKSIDFTHFITSNIANLQNAFDNCKSLKELDLSSFDTSNVKDMSYMFRYSEVIDLDLSSLDVSNVTTMVQMFMDSKIVTLNLSNLNASSVTSMSNMFSGCSALTTLSLANLDVSNVTNMQSMFNGCSSLVSLDLSSFVPSKVSNITFMFQNCSNLTDLDVSNFDASNVTTMQSMFNGCSNLVDLDLSSFVTPKLTNISLIFQNCTKLTNLDVSNFDVSNVASFEAVFRGTAIEVLDLSSWVPLSATVFQNMFYNMKNLISVDLSNFNTPSATNMTNMFMNCEKLTELDLTAFDTTNVKTMNFMFSSCKKLLKVDLSSFYTPNLTNIQSMFATCSVLMEIDFRNADFTNVTNYGSVLSGTKYVSNPNPAPEMFVNQANADIIQASAFPTAAKNKLVVV